MVEINVSCQLCKSYCIMSIITFRKEMADEWFERQKYAGQIECQLTE